MKRLLYLCGAILAALPAQAADPQAADPQTADPMDFWDQPQFGANSFNSAPPDESYFRALAATGASWVRLTFSKWKWQGRDFLIGSADNYTGLVAEDLATLRQVLGHAERAGIRVVLTPLSLPGSRWQQHNDGKLDKRLWQDKTYWQQAASFWSDLARDLKGHPAIAAYNLLNEPAPERVLGLAENGPIEDTRRFMDAHKGTAADLVALYAEMIAAIRQVDATVPVMVDAGFYANPRNLAAWPGPLADSRVLYSFHMYEPYSATSAPNRRRKIPLRYPGVTTYYDGAETSWDRAAVSAHINAAYEWGDANKLAPGRIVASEFGCLRTWADCGTYLTDVLDALSDHKSHWAFYTFRPDEWEGMDYEIPAAVPPGRFYWLVEEGKMHRLPRDGQLMDLIKGYMSR